MPDHLSYLPEDLETVEFSEPLLGQLGRSTPDAYWRHRELASYLELTSVAWGPVVFVSRDAATPIDPSHCAWRLTGDRFDGSFNMGGFSSSDHMFEWLNVAGGIRACVQPRSV